MADQDSKNYYKDTNSLGAQRRIEETDLSFTDEELADMRACSGCKATQAELARIRALAAKAYSYFIADIRDADAWPTAAQRMAVAHKILEVEQAIAKLVSEGLQAAPVAVPAQDFEIAKEYGFTEQETKDIIAAETAAPLPPPQEPECIQCGDVLGEHSADGECSGFISRPAALAGETRQEALDAFAKRIQEFVSGTNLDEADSFTIEERAGIKAVIADEMRDAASRIAQLERELTEQTLLRESFERQWNIRCEMFYKQVELTNEAEAALTQAQAQKSALMEAIEPFATYCEKYKSKYKDGPATVSYHDLFKAARVYEQAKEAGE